MNSQLKILFFIERELHIPFLEPIYDYFNENFDFDLAFITVPYIKSSEDKPGRGINDKELKRLKEKAKFIYNSSEFKPDLTYVADVSFSLKDCGKIINVGHGLISKGGFFVDSPIVRRENLADLICVPGTWHKEVLEKNVFVPIVATGFIKSDKLFGPKAISRNEYCQKYNIPQKNSIILYAPTFNKELSSIPIIEDKIAQLANNNTTILIKLHSVTDAKYVEMYKKLANFHQNIIFVDEIDVSPSLIAADILISDVSSVLVEFMLLNKPVIVFNNPNISQYSHYNPDDIEYQVREACYVVNNFEELYYAVKKAMIFPEEFSARRKFYSYILCYGKDGKSVERAAHAGLELLNYNFASKENIEISVVFQDDENNTNDNINNIIDIFNKYTETNIEIILLSNKHYENEFIKILPKNSNIGDIINNSAGEFIFFDDFNLNFPSNYLRTLIYYFKWYPNTFAVECLTEKDNYKDITRDYFPQINENDLEEIQFNFRYFIAQDIRISQLNSFPAIFKKDNLNNYVNAKNFNELIKAINNSPHNDKFRKAIDVFAYKNQIELNNYSKEELIQLIEKNSWNLEARLKLYSLQKDNLSAKHQEVFQSNTKKLTSIIILAKDQFEYTKECIDSIYQFTPEPFELVLIDNGSRDNIPNYFAELKRTKNNVKVVKNIENVGFPKGVNQGLREAVGDYVLIGNNDTIVTPGWLKRMQEVIESNPKIGLVGPMSNNISGLQLIENLEYSTLQEMLQIAENLKRNYAGQTIEFPRLAFFCTLIKREVIDKIGGLDEIFSPGNYEDDDFCMRSQIAGYKALILKDVFIHHYRSRSFVDDGNDAYRERLQKNRSIFAKKWGGTPEEIWLEGKKIMPPELYINYK